MREGDGGGRGREERGRREGEKDGGRRREEGRREEGKKKEGRRREEGEKKEASIIIIEININIFTYIIMITCIGSRIQVKLTKNRATHGFQ